MNLHELESEIQVWQSMHWPDGVDVHRCMTKITEELGELGRALIRGEDQSVIESEAADVIITVIAAMTGLGASAADGIEAKWPVVRDRDPRARHVPEKSVEDDFDAEQEAYAEVMEDYYRYGTPD